MGTHALDMEQVLLAGKTGLGMLASQDISQEADEY